MKLYSRSSELTEFRTEPLFRQSILTPLHRLYQLEFPPLPFRVSIKLFQYYLHTTCMNLKLGLRPYLHFRLLNVLIYLQILFSLSSRFIIFFIYYIKRSEHWMAERRRKIGQFQPIGQFQQIKQSLNLILFRY